MYDKRSMLYKIGRSKNVEYREKILEGQVPEIITILVCEKNIESFLHREYSNKRKRGEWFSLTADDILDMIKEYGFIKYATWRQEKHP